MMMTIAPNYHARQKERVQGEGEEVYRRFISIFIYWEITQDIWSL